METKLTQNALDRAVSIRQLANWVGINDLSIIKRWPWIQEHKFFLHGKSGITMVPLWVVEEFVGGALEPLYTLTEVATYLGISAIHARSLLNRAGKKIVFGHRTVRYPESAVTELVAKAPKSRKYRPSI